MAILRGSQQTQPSDDSIVDYSSDGKDSQGMDQPLYYQTLSSTSYPPQLSPLRSDGGGCRSGYVEFQSEETVSKAIELTGQKLKGVPIIVQLTEAEKNRASRAAAASEGGAAANNGAPFHWLFIRNIHFSVTEEDLLESFFPFGPIEQITLEGDATDMTRISDPPAILDVGQLV